MIQERDLTKEIAQRNLNKSFRSLLRERDFKKILSFIISGASLSEIQSYLFMVTLKASNKNHVIKIFLDDEAVLTIPINPTLKKDMEKFLRYGL